MFRYDRLDELVAETGKKKNYLSIRMGHSGRYLNDAKKQNIQIKKHDVEILAAELGTTPEYLNDETDKKEKPDLNDEIGPFKAQLLSAVSDLTEAEQNLLLEHIGRIKQLRG